MDATEWHIKCLSVLVTRKDIFITRNNILITRNNVTTNALTHQLVNKLVPNTVELLGGQTRHLLD